MLYNAVFLLYNELNQLYTDIHPVPLELLLPPPIPLPQILTEHRAELPVPYRSSPLASYFTHGSVYISMLLSQFMSPSPFPYFVYKPILYVLKG